MKILKLSSGYHPPVGILILWLDLLSYSICKAISVVGTGRSGVVAVVYHFSDINRL